MGTYNRLYLQVLLTGEQDMFGRSIRSCLGTRLDAVEEAVAMGQEKQQGKSCKPLQFPKPKCQVPWVPDTAWALWMLICELPNHFPELLGQTGSRMSELCP